MEAINGLLPFSHGISITTRGRRLLWWAGCSADDAQELIGVVREYAEETIVPRAKTKRVL